MSLKKILLILSLFIIYFAFYSFSYANSISHNLETNLFRLRIVANSNSLEDQEIKLEIRDKLIDYLNNVPLNSKEETIFYIQNHQFEISNIVSSVLQAHHTNYSAQYEISNSFYQKRSYQNITLPSGYYDGLQIKLGKAKGKNWWCILFPELCLIDSQTYKITNTDFSHESTEIISSHKPQYKLKFKIIDFINNL